MTVHLLLVSEYVHYDLLCQFQEQGQAECAMHGLDCYKAK